MGEFEVPRRAVEQSGPVIPAQTGDTSTDHKDVNFSVPDRAVHDLGRTAGETSDAAKLLVSAEEEAAAAPAPPETAIDQWTRERNQELAKRNFSFYSGETAAIFDELSPRQQKKVTSLADKLIELYSDRGVNEQAVGLVKDNDIMRHFRKHPGGAVMGEAYDEFYIVCMGKPLENLRLADKLESESDFIRYRGRKFPIRNFLDMEPCETFGGPFGSPRKAVPRLNDNEWLPALLAITKLETW